MRAVRVRSVVPLVAAVILFVGACASPPEAEKKAADAAVSAASSAGAEKYAPSEFSAMTAAVKKAESEMSNKAYKEAKASYESAKDLAEKAAKAAESGKAAAKATADKQLADLDARWQDLKVKAETATKNLKAEQKAEWDATGKAIGEAFEAAKGAAASDAAAAKDKIAAIGPLLDKWEADVTALASAPPKDDKKAAVADKKGAAKK
jgi:hypothetical protein